MTSPGSSALPFSPGFPGTRHPTPGTSWEPACEVSLRRMRQTDGLRGAATPWGRDPGGLVQVSGVWPSRGYADKPDGNAAGLVALRRNREPDGVRAAAPNG